MNQSYSPQSAEYPSITNKRRRIPWRLLLLVEVILIIVIMFAIHLWLEQQAMGQAPEFLVQDVNGTEISLAQYLTKGPVLLRFWADWCPNCKLEEDMINRLAIEGQVLTVAIQSGSSAKVAAFLEAESLTMPTIADEDGRIANLYKVNGVPATFIIDSDGEIRFRVLGLSSEWSLRLRLWAAQWL